MKTFTGHVQFFAVEVKVKAKNTREAKKKIREKLKKKKASSLIDSKNFWVDIEI